MTDGFDILYNRYIKGDPEREKSFKRDIEITEKVKEWTPESFVGQCPDDYQEELLTNIAGDILRLWDRVLKLEE